MGGVELTYPEVGATRAEQLPTGYRHVERRARLGTGPDVYRRAADALAHFAMHRAAGLAVQASAGTATVGGEVASGFGVGPLRTWAPCRIVWLVDESDRYGYGYGTLPNHPEHGEEAFVVWRDEAGVVWFDVRAFSRPAKLSMCLAGPLGHLVQDFITARYLRAMRRLAAG